MMTVSLCLHVGNPITYICTLYAFHLGGKPPSFALGAINILKSCLNGSYTFKQITRNENLLFTGVSIFEPISNERIQHTKKGSYILNGQEQEFFQIRYFVFQPGRMIMEKYEESLLHEFIIPDNYPGLPLTLHHIHHCNDDKYNITLKISSLDEFQTEYIIKGPKKNEIIQSFYTRIN